MASQVPYQPVPDVSPQVDPIAHVGVNAPDAAFGGAVAGAITHLGDTAEGAGKELFARAYAMQELNEQDKANAAVAQYQNELTGRFVDYTQKQGQDAIHGLPQFMQDTEDLRGKYAGDLSSPFAQQTFNTESRQARFRMVFSAGNYAREEMKKFSRESTSMRVDAAGNEAAAAVSAGNIDGAEQGIQRAGELARTQAENEGLDPESVNTAEVNGRSRVTSGIVRELAKTQPIAAEKYRDDALKKGNISATDAQNLDGIIHGQKLMQGSRSIGSGVISGADKAWDTTSVGPSRAMEVLAKSSGTGGYESSGAEDPNGNGHPVGKYGVPSTELGRWLTDAGLPAMTEQDFLKNHDAQDKVAQTKFDEFQKRYGGAPGALKAWASGIDTDNRVAQGRRAMADTASHSELSGVTSKAADAAAPGDDVFKDLTQTHVENTKARTERFLQEDQRQNVGAVDDALLGVNAQNGKLPTSVPELLADPKVRDAYDKLDDKQRYQVNKAIQHNINQGGYDFTIASQAKFERLYGISVDPNSTVEERKQLLDLQVGAEEMPAAARMRLREAQKKIVDGATSNPPLTHALQVLGPVMQSYNISKTTDPDRYSQFVGALHDSMQGYGEGQLKAVKSDDEIKQIGLRLLRTVPGTAGIFTSGTKAFEETPTDNQASRQVRDTLSKQYGRPATEDEVTRALLRQTFQMVGAKGGMK